MKPTIFKKAAAAVVSAAMLGTVVGANYPEKNVQKATAADEFHDDWLHVNDKAEVVDMNGNPVWKGLFHRDAFGTAVQGHAFLLLPDEQPRRGSSL